MKSHKGQKKIFRPLFENRCSEKKFSHNVYNSEVNDNNSESRIVRGSHEQCNGELLVVRTVLVACVYVMVS